jgi:hypothetical protein
MRLRRLVVVPALALSVALLASACEEDSPTSPSANPNQVRFTAQLSPANEVPAVSNAEGSGIGTASITLDLTRDGGGAITAASTTFQIALSGFPANTPANIAHIHEAASGVNGPIVVNTGLVAGNVVLTSGAGSFSRTVSTTPAVAQNIINNPAGYYFNVHSTLNPGGFARGQLVRVN